MNNYPENSVQYLTEGGWWEEDKSGKLSRGSLVNAYVQFFSEIPYELIAERSHPTAHDCISVKAAPLSVQRGSASTATLPIAALPRLNGAECYIANRAKRRPCLVLGTVDKPSIAKSLKLTGFSPSILAASHSHISPMPSTSKSFWSGL